MTDMYLVSHIPRKDVMGVTFWAWMTIAQAFGYEDLPELVEIFADFTEHGGGMVSEIVKSSELEILGIN